MATMEWVHMAWNGCIIGNLSEAEYLASLYYFVCFACFEFKSTLAPT